VVPLLRTPMSRCSPPSRQLQFAIFAFLLSIQASFLEIDLCAAGATESQAGVDADLPVHKQVRIAVFRESVRCPERGNQTMCEQKFMDRFKYALDQFQGINKQLDFVSNFDRI
jgi:hypothetical protein